MTEVVDIVDEHGEPIGKTTKNEAHLSGLLHRTVIGEMRDTLGNIVLVKRSQDRPDAGLFVSAVGGHVRTGETEDEALRRETLEEIGLERFQYRHIGRFIFDRTLLRGRENHYYSVFEIYANPGDIVLGSEATALAVFSKKQLTLALRRTPQAFGESFHAVVGRLYPELLIG